MQVQLESLEALSSLYLNENNVTKCQETLDEGINICNKNPRQTEINEIKKRLQLKQDAIKRSSMVIKLADAGGLDLTDSNKVTNGNQSENDEFDEFSESKKARFVQIAHN